MDAAALFAADARKKLTREEWVAASASRADARRWRPLLAWPFGEKGAALQFARGGGALYITTSIGRCGAVPAAGALGARKAGAHAGWLGRAAARAPAGLRATQRPGREAARPATPCAPRVRTPHTRTQPRHYWPPPF